MSGQLKLAAAVVGTLLGVKLLLHGRSANSAPVIATGGDSRQSLTKTVMESKRCRLSDALECLRVTDVRKSSRVRICRY